MVFSTLRSLQVNWKTHFFQWQNGKIFIFPGLLVVFSHIFIGFSFPTRKLHCFNKFLWLMLRRQAGVERGGHGREHAGIELEMQIM